MRTRIRILKPYNSFQKEKGELANKDLWIDVGNNSLDDKPIYRYCEWTNSHGNDYLISDSKQAKNKPKIKLRYDPRITAECRILKDDDSNYYEIIGEPDNIKDKNQFMEIRLERIING